MSFLPALSVLPLQTRIFQDKESLLDFVVEHVNPEHVHESMILVVTSKIVSLAEGRLVSKTEISKEALVAQEAEYNLGQGGYGCFLTIKHGLFIASAGIDESNSQSDQFILYPADPYVSAKKLWTGLRQRWNLKNLGILMTDSHTSPLRKGVMGIALSHWGFHGLKNMVGTSDLFGRRLQMTTVNVADGLAAAATLMMGEGSESRPLALVNCAEIKFTEEIDPNELRFPMKDDLYYPFFKHLIKD